MQQAPCPYSVPPPHEENCGKRHDGPSSENEGSAPGETRIRALLDTAKGESAAALQRTITHRRNNETQTLREFWASGKKTAPAAQEAYS